MKRQDKPNSYKLGIFTSRVTYPGVLKKPLFDLVPGGLYIFIRPLKNLQVNRIGIEAWASSKFGQIELSNKATVNPLYNIGVGPSDL